MMAKAVERSGGCLCGAVRYAVRGKPLWIARCHCESCRRATSAAFATYAGFRKERFTLTSGRPAHFRSSPGVNDPGRQHGRSGGISADAAGRGRNGL